MTALRWVAHIVFVVALLTWGRMAIRSTDRPETWPETRRRTAAFVVMVGAAVASIALAPRKGSGDEEETF